MLVILECIYICTVTNSDGSGSASTLPIGIYYSCILFQYVVVSPSGLVSINPPNATASRGENITLSCTIGGGSRYRLHMGMKQT